VTNEAPVPVVRLKVTAPRGAVNVSFGSGSGYSLAHYTVDKNGSQLRSAPWASPSVVEVKYIFATGCGSSNAFIVHVTPKADVYRIQAENKIWLVPDLSSDYSIYDGHGVLTVGHIAAQSSRSRSITRWVLIGLPNGRMASKGLSIRQSVTLSRRLVVAAKS